MCSSCEKVCNSCSFNEMVTYSELCFLQFNFVSTFCLSGGTLSLLWLSFYFLSFLVSGLAAVLPVAWDQIPHNQDLTRCSNTAKSHVGTKPRSGWCTRDWGTKWRLVNRLSLFIACLWEQWELAIHFSWSHNLVRALGISIYNFEIR